MGKTDADIFPVRNGFTLIELIIVTGVIGVLAGGLLIGMNPIAHIQTLLL